VSERVTIGIVVDDTEAQAQLEGLQDKVDTTVTKWKTQRAIIMSQLQEVNRGIGLALQAVRMAVRATGQTLDPMQSAALALVGSTSSIIISTAIALAAGSLGLLAGAALALAAFAYGFELAQTAKILAEFMTLHGKFDAMDMTLSRLTRMPPGGLGGI